LNELWTAAEVAEYLGAASSDSARRTLSRWGVKAVAYRPGPSGRVVAHYRADEVRAARAARPGRGVGGGRPRKTRKTRKTAERKTMQTLHNPLDLEISWEDPNDLVTLHDVLRPDDLKKIVASMTDGGWKGAPLVVHHSVALTGVHRITAAIQVGLSKVPTVQAAELFARAGIDFPKAEASTRDLGPELEELHTALLGLKPFARWAWDLGPQLEALYHSLPEDIRDAYGLDV